MSQFWYLVGPQADRGFLAAMDLQGERAEIEGLVQGTPHTGLKADSGPVLAAGRGRVAAMKVQPNEHLRKYAAVMGLAPQKFDGKTVLVGQSAATLAPWEDQFAPLFAELARLIVRSPGTPDEIRKRLPMLGTWAGSRLRGRANTPSGGDLVPRHSADDLRMFAQEQPYAGFFAVEAWDLSHRRHDGGFTPQVRREGFVSGDAVVVLPWDPVRDRVMVIEQFRLIPALRTDPQPWLLEAIAGRIDIGETPEQAALREAQEEAALTIGKLFPAVHNYPSPGTLAEFLYLYVGIADLPDEVVGIHGLDVEAEDIRSHVIARSKLMQMVEAGQITNGPLVMLALWLGLNADRLRAEQPGEPSPD